MILSPSNPMEKESQEAIRDKIKEEGADFGILFDGDGDRIIFFDENGKKISSDYILLLLLKDMVKPSVVYDFRMSKILPESIESWGGISMRSKTGHTFVKQVMVKQRADIAGEIAGHFFFKEFNFNESSLFFFLKILNVLERENKPLSELIKPFQKYYNSEEINTTINNKQEAVKILEKIKEKYKDGKIDELDGVTVEYWDSENLGSRWWFNLRPSNTEPLIRLVIEADTKEMMEEKTKELVGLIKQLG